ncbi:hypothetical protein YC2023_071317 [Brassica napus]
MRSPDTKGASTSKKLALHGRASPKGKLFRHGNPSSVKPASSTKLSRFESVETQNDPPDFSKDESARHSVITSKTNMLFMHVI